MKDYTGTTIKLPQEVALSLHQQLTVRPSRWCIVSRRQKI